MSALSDRLVRVLVRVDGEPAPLPAPLAAVEALLLQGKFPEALKSLSGGDGAAAFLEGAARLALGDAPGAAKAAERAGAEPAAQAALRGVLAARAGDDGAADAALSAAAAAAPKRAWPWVLAASVLEARRDFAAADAALGRAVKIEPLGWIHAERARVREYLGVLPDAIASAAAAIAVDPTPEHHRLKGELHERWREHEKAAAEYARALKLAPAEAGLSWLRARALSAAGDFPGALAAAGHTLRLAPEDEGFRAWTIQLRIVAGREKEAERELAALLMDRKTGPSLRAQAAFLRAYLDMRRRRWSAARQGFEALSEGGGEGPFARKSSFYAATCRVLEDGGPASAKERLVLAGLGVSPPYTATAESVRLMAGATVLFNNVMGDEMFEFLRALCPDARPIAYHQNGDEGRLSDEMMAAAVKKGARAVFVTRGSAIVYGPLGTELMRRCVEKGLPCRALAAVSSADSILARLGADEATRRGCAVADSGALDAPGWTDARIPLTAYVSFERGDGAFERFCSSAAAARGPESPCSVFDHVIGQEPLTWRVRELAEKKNALSVSAIAHFPAKEGTK